MENRNIKEKPWKSDNTVRLDNVKHKFWKVISLY